MSLGILNIREKSETVISNQTQVQIKSISHLVLSDIQCDDSRVICVSSA